MYPRKIERSNSRGFLQSCFDYQMVLILYMKLEQKIGASAFIVLQFDT